MCVDYWYQSLNYMNINEAYDHLSKEILRMLFKKKNAKALKDKPWVFDCPAFIRDEAVLDFVVSKKQARLKFDNDKELNGKANFPTLKFKSKKRKLKESFGFPQREYNQSKMFGWVKRIRSKESFELKYDTRIIKEPDGKIYIVVPETLKKYGTMKVETQDLIVCAIDPGIRTFATIFNNKGEIFEYGDKDIGKIIRTVQHADKLQSKIYKKNENETFQLNHRKRYNMRKAFRKMKMKITNWIRDFHHKVAKHIVQHNDLILLPRFETQQMIRKGKRKIHSKTVRQMVTWSHFKFQQRLIHKAKKYDKIVELCEEHYTSKCCSNCGNIKWNLKGQKVYYCRECKSRFGRDINGAKNILLKYLIERKAGLI